MYKITLFDDNMPSCTSGTESYYCDDIDKFEEEWVKLEKDEDRIVRFRRSKAGEMVTDYYCDIPELNIVQQDKWAKIFYERDVYLEDEWVTIQNGYGWESDYYIFKGHIHLCHVRYGTELLLIAEYRIKGICTKCMFQKKMYEPVVCYGNPILKYSIDYEREPTEYLSSFKDDTIESIAYLELKRFRGLKEMYDDHKDRDRVDMTEGELSRLFRDIPGEAG